MSKTINTQFHRLSQVTKSEIMVLMNNPSVKRQMPLLKGDFNEDVCNRFIQAKEELWNTYGSAAPLVTERITELEDAYPPSSQGTELLDQAIIDLEEEKTWMAGIIIFQGRNTMWILKKL